jgi:hypothetical protein
MEFLQRYVHPFSAHTNNKKSLSDCHSDKPALTTTDFPFDFDTTSLGLTIFRQENSLVNKIMDEMLCYRDEDDIIQVRWFLRLNIFFKILIEFSTDLF